MLAKFISDIAVSQLLSWAIAPSHEIAVDTGFVNGNEESYVTVGISM